MQKDPTKFWLAVPKPHLHWQPKYSSTITHIKYSILPYIKIGLSINLTKFSPPGSHFRITIFEQEGGRPGIPLYHTWHIVNSITLYHITSHNILLYHLVFTVARY